MSSRLIYVVMVRAKGSSSCGYPTAACESEALARELREALAALPRSNAIHQPLEATFVEPVPLDSVVPPAILEMAA